MVEVWSSWVRRRVKWAVLLSMILNALLMVMVLILGRQSDCSQLQRLIQQVRRQGNPPSYALGRPLSDAEMPRHRHLGYEPTAKSLRLTHVVMPFHQSQVEQASKNLESWRLYPPCQPAENGKPGDELLWHEIDDSHRWWRERMVEGLGRNISLVMFLNGQPDAAIEGDLRQQFANLPAPIRSCWASMEVRWARLPPERDTYLSGSRSMFEVMLNGWVGLKEAHYVLYMEPDARPVRPYWLSHLDATTRWPNPPFWLKGSLFRGDPQAIKAHLLMNLFHVNGNGIYNLGDPEFRQFYWQRVRDWVARSKKTFAYDTDIFRFLLHAEDDAYARSVAHLFQHTDCIQNLYHSNYSVSELRQKSSQVVLVHGGTPSQ